MSSSGTAGFQEQVQAHIRMLAEQPAAWHVAKNLRWMETHCRTFGIGEAVQASVAYQGFRELVREVAYATVELSIKVAGDSVQAGRFNLFCVPQDVQGFVAAVISFFEAVKAAEAPALDLSLLRRFLEGDVDWTCVSRLVVGLDLREQAVQSRLKLWFFANDEAGIARNPVQKLLAMHGSNVMFDALHLHPALLFGYDLCFDGTTGVRSYPDITAEEFASDVVQSRLQPVLSPRTMLAMREASWTHFQIASRNRDLMVQLHPMEPSAFLAKWAPHPVAARVHGLYGGVPLLDVVVSLPMRELERGEVENFSLYYMPAGVPEI
jgi:LynF/TruF/PatF family peptide O-prenyltransferase